MMRRIGHAAIWFILISQPQAFGADLKPVTLKLEFYSRGEHAAFAYGVEKGIYKKAGLDLKLLEGKGSFAVAKELTKSTAIFQYGWGDAGSVIKASLDEGKRLILIGDLVQLSPPAIAVLADSGINSIKDLNGKRIAFTANDATRLQWPAVVAKLGLDRSKIQEVIAYTPDAKLKILADGNVDAMSGFFMAHAGLVEKTTKKKIKWLNFSEVGVSHLAHGIFISERDLNQSEQHCAMMRGTTEAWKAAAKDIDGAVDALHRIFPSTNEGDKTATKMQLQDTLNRTYTERSKGRSMGYIDAEDWKNLINFLLETKEVKKISDPASYYTNQFVDCKV